jgi:hypothetical protein
MNEESTSEKVWHGSAVMCKSAGCYEFATGEVQIGEKYIPLCEMHREAEMNRLTPKWRPLPPSSANSQSQARLLPESPDSASCDLCNGTGITDGALGLNRRGLCPRCHPVTWGPYRLQGDWYALTPQTK